MKKIFKGLINDCSEIQYTKFQVSMSFSSTYRLFENLLRIYSKKLPKNLKIAISRSKLKISKNKKKTFLGINTRIPHAKNQLPTLKTVTCRADTDTHAHTHTDRQR